MRSRPSKIGSGVSRNGSAVGMLLWNRFERCRTSDQGAVSLTSAGSGRRHALARLGIEGMSTLPAFDHVAERLARCMSDLADLMHEIEFDGGRASLDSSRASAHASFGSVRVWFDARGSPDGGQPEELSAPSRLKAGKPEFNAMSRSDAVLLPDVADDAGRPIRSGSLMCRLTRTSPVPSKAMASTRPRWASLVTRFTRSGLGR